MINAYFKKNLSKTTLLQHPANGSSLDVFYTIHYSPWKIDCLLWILWSLASFVNHSCTPCFFCLFLFCFVLFCFFVLFFVFLFFLPISHNRSFTTFRKHHLLPITTVIVSRHPIFIYLFIYVFIYLFINYFFFFIIEVAFLFRASYLNPKRTGLFGPISQPGGGRIPPPKISETDWQNIKCVVLVDSYDPPESIGTKKSTNISCMTPQCRHKWRHVKNTKITKNRQNHGFSLFFQAKFAFFWQWCVSKYAYTCSYSK